MTTVEHDDDFDVDVDESGLEAELVNDGGLDSEDIADSGEDTDGDTSEGDGATVNTLVAADGDPSSTEDAEKAAAEKAAAEAAEKAAAAEKLKVERETNMKEFMSAVESAVVSEERDQGSGELPTAIVETVTLPFSKVRAKKDREELQAYLTNKMSEFMVADSVPLARTYMQLLMATKNLTVSRPQISATPVDPTEAWVAHVTALLLSSNFASPVPEGVAENWQDLVRAKRDSLLEQAAKYITWHEANHAKSDEEKEKAPEVDAIVLRAAQIASGKGATKAPRKNAKPGTSAAPAERVPFTGQRRDIAVHVQSAFANLDSGAWLSIGEIVNHRSEEYGDVKPSQGAIGARLYPNDGGACTIEGVIPEIRNVDGRDKKGARKA